METHIEIPTRQRWTELLAQFGEPERLDYRRSDQRSYVQLGAAKLSFDDEQGTPVVRTGRLLNASDSGLMVKQYEIIPEKTEMHVEVTIGEETFALTGRVVHTTETLGGFKVGIELRFAD